MRWRFAIVNYLERVIMTSLQKQIRNLVEAEGYTHINVGKGSPATLATVKALRSAGYACIHRGYHGFMAVYQVTKEI